MRLREELAEAHHRSRLAVERSYAAAARAEALAAEVAQLMAVIRATPAPVTSFQFLPMMTPAPVQPAPAAPLQPPVAPAPAGSRGPGCRRCASRCGRGQRHVARPPAGGRRGAQSSFASPVDPARQPRRARVRVDLRAVEPKARYPRGA